MAWVKPIERDDWGSVTIRVGTRTLEPGRHRVRWPDGAEEMVDVVVRRETADVGDHGSSYRVTSDVPHIDADHHGVLVCIRATLCEFWVET